MAYPKNPIPSSEAGPAGRSAPGSVPSGRQPIPRPCFLDTCDYLGYMHGERRWRDSLQDLIYTWDTLHGEIEAFTPRGRHVGAFHPLSGQQIKPAVKGRRIRV
jgi:hypothetical protein